MSMTQDQVTLCARAGHDSMLLWSGFLAEPYMLPWDQAPDWQQQPALAMMAEMQKWHPVKMLHDAWVTAMTTLGWSFGPLDATTKHHPNMVTYDKLPLDQQKKVMLFRTCASAMMTMIGDGR